MSSNINSISVGRILVQSGIGAPTHSAPQGSIYVDATSSTQYLNVDGTNTWKLASSGGAFLSLSGGTVTGGTIFTVGLTATTISATTYQGLPIYQRLNDNDIVNLFNYCGLALSGTSQNDPTWNISRISWSSTTPTTAYAVGAWSGRTSLIYT